MDEGVSIAATILGALLELLAVIGLAHLMDAQIPKRTCQICAAAGLGITGLAAAVAIVGSIWGAEPLWLGVVLLALAPGPLLAACGIWALIQWVNRRDDPVLRPSHPESRPGG
jgi:hypothetical protein